MRHNSTQPNNEQLTIHPLQAAEYFPLLYHRRPSTSPGRMVSLSAPARADLAASVWLRNHCYPSSQLYRSEYIPRVPAEVLERILEEAWHAQQTKEERIQLMKTSILVSRVYLHVYLYVSSRRTFILNEAHAAHLLEFAAGRTPLSTLFPASADVFKYSCHTIIIPSKCFGNDTDGDVVYRDQGVLWIAYLLKAHEMKGPLDPVGEMLKKRFGWMPGGDEKQKNVHSLYGQRKDVTNLPGMRALVLDYDAANLWPGLRKSHIVDRSID